MSFRFPGRLLPRPRAEDFTRLHLCPTCQYYPWTAKTEAVFEGTRVHHPECPVVWPSERADGKVIKR